MLSFTLCCCSELGESLGTGSTPSETASEYLPHFVPSILLCLPLLVINDRTVRQHETRWKSVHVITVFKNESTFNICFNLKPTLALTPAGANFLLHLLHVEATHSPASQENILDKQDIHTHIREKEMPCLSIYNYIHRNIYLYTYIERNNIQCAVFFFTKQFILDVFPYQQVCLKFLSAFACKHRYVIPQKRCRSLLMNLHLCFLLINTNNSSDNSWSCM
jgi:hypothetical protein